MTTNASVKVDSSRRTSAPGVLLDQLVPAVFKMTSSRQLRANSPRGAKGTRFQRLSMAINWQHEAHPTTGERFIAVTVGSSRTYSPTRVPLCN